MEGNPLVFPPRPVVDQSVDAIKEHMVIGGQVRIPPWRIEKGA